MKKIVALVLASTSLMACAACAGGDGYKEQTIKAQTPNAYKFVLEYFDTEGNTTSVYAEARDSVGNLWIGRTDDIENGMYVLSEQVQLISDDGKYRESYYQRHNSDGTWTWEELFAGFDLSVTRNFGKYVDDYVFTGTKEKGIATTYLDRPCTVYEAVSVQKEQYNYKSYYDRISTYELIVDDATGIILQSTIKDYVEDWDYSYRYNPGIGSGYRFASFTTEVENIRDTVYAAMNKE